MIAGEYEVSMAALFHALASYDDNREAFARRELEAARRRTAGERRSRELLE